jgi:hypothetical protein
MSAKFKFKPTKNKFAAEKTYSLNDIHKEKMNSYYENKRNLPIRYKELNNLLEKLKRYENKQVSSSDDIKKRVDIKIKIDELKEEIYKLEKNDDVKNYVSRSHNIVVNYYNISTKEEDTSDDDSCSESEPDDNKFSTDDKHSGCSKNLFILNKINQQGKKVKRLVKKRVTVPEETNATSIIKFLGVEKCSLKNKDALSRNTLQDKFISLETNTQLKNIKNTSIVMCNKCNIEKILFQSEGCYFCPNRECGEVEYIAIDSEIPSHKDAINEKPKYPYKKINHLKEKLSQLQSKETINIDKKIIKLIKNELRKKRVITDACGPSDIKKILKKNKLHDYYEHLQQLYCIISGKPPISLSRETEEKIISMFNEMQDSFKMHKPHGRSNFLNYSYTLNRLFNILDMSEHAKFFNLLKSKDKLKDQDTVWKKICLDMNWDYLKSIGKKNI